MRFVRMRLSRYGWMRVVDVRMHACMHACMRPIVIPRNSTKRLFS